MPKTYSIVLTVTDEKAKGLMKELQKYSLNSRHTTSCTGIELATFVVAALELLVMLICIPAVSSAIDSRKILVKFNGYTFNNTAKELLLRLKQDPELMTLLKEAYKSNSLELKGSAKQIVMFRRKIKEFLADER